MTVCLTRDCTRERIPESATGIRHAHCESCESRLLGEAWGPISWQDRATTGTLPPLVTGGVPIETRRDQTRTAAGHNRGSTQWQVTRSASVRAMTSPS